MATLQTSSISLPFSRRSLIAGVFAGVTLLLFLLQLPFFLRGGVSNVLEYLAQHLFILLWIGVLTAANRTLPFTTIVMFWLLGVFPIMALDLLIGVPIAEGFGLSRPLAPAFVLPFIEEVLKSLPILLYFAYLVWRRDWQPSATDGLLLGLAIGAGFAFHEDAMFRRVFGEGWTATPLSPLLPTIAGGRLAVGGRAYLSYHAIEAALNGLAIGTAFLFRRYKLAWLIPPVVWLIVYFDHATFNYLVTPLISLGQADTVLALRTLVLSGLLPPLLLLVGLAVTVVVEQIILFKMGRRDRLFDRVSSWRIASALFPLSRSGIERWNSLRQYARSRRAVHYALWAWGKKSVRVERAMQLGANLFVVGIRGGLPLDRRMDIHSDESDEGSRTAGTGEFGEASAVGLG